MKILQSKKIFLTILVFSLLFNFLPLSAESNFKPPVLNATNLIFNGRVNAIAIDEKTGIVYLGGEFTKVGDIERNGLAAIGTDGTLQSWNPNVGGINIITTEDGEASGSSIYTLAVKGSTIYVGGFFNTIGGEIRNNLAAIGTDGAILDWNPNANYNVNSLVIKGSTIYVGGAFNSIGGKERFGLAAISTDDSLQNWNPGVSGEVHALAIKGSTIYTGGSFYLIGGKERYNLGAIRTNGTVLNWNPKVRHVEYDVDEDYFSYYDGSIVKALAIKGSTIYVGGKFHKIGETERKNLAAIGIDGTLLDWNPKVEYADSRVDDSIVNALAIKGSTIYAGGSFTSIGGKERYDLGAIRANGVLHNWFPVFSGFHVNTVVVKGSTVYIGGYFNAISKESGSTNFEPRSNFASFSIPKDSK